MGWFPRLSPTGYHVAEQLHTDTGIHIGINGVKVAENGIQPVWLNENIVMYSSTLRAELRQLERQEGQDVWKDGKVLELPYPCNGLDANGVGGWVAWMPNWGIKWNTGEMQGTYGAPTIDDDGNVYCVRDGILFKNGIVTVSNVRIPRCSNNLIAWVDTTDHLKVGPPSWGQYVTCHWTVPVKAPFENWVVIVTNDSLVAHKEGDYMGYRLPGDAFYPDAMWDGDGIKVVFTRNGETMFHWFKLYEPRVDIRETIPVPPIPPIPPTPTPIPPEPPHPQPEPPMKPYLNSTQERAMYDRFRTDCVEANRLDFDAASQMGTHESRTCYDYVAGMTFEKSLNKHSNEFRATLGLAPLPPPFEPTPTPPVGDKFNWRGNFLALPEYPFAFMYPAWSKGKQDRFVEKYRELGLTHLPLSPFAKYREYEYDYSRDPQGFTNLIADLKGKGITVCVMALTDSSQLHHPKSFDECKEWAKWYYPQVTGIELASTGWEFNQIGGGQEYYWCGNGTKHIEWAKHLKGLISAPLYVHFSPERITGWPNYPDHSGPQDEAGWWGAIDEYVVGILYQRPPDEPLNYTLAHMLGGTDESGGYDIGDAERLTNTWRVNKHFVAFELSRDFDRWLQIINAVRNDKRIKGWG